jgi:hypothetical protein
MVITYADIIVAYRVLHLFFMVEYGYENNELRSKL